MSEHLEELIAHAEESYDKPLPRYVVSELRDFLKCGRLEEGFVRCHCAGCGADLLVPFSCGARSTCPACASRRMCNTAAFLIDRVLPNLPVRQWVLSLPWELRPVAAAKPDVLGATGRLFVDTVLRELKRTGGRPGAESGAVCFVHRAGGSLNLNPHLHVLVLDGLLVGEPGDELRFEAALPPSPEMLERVVGGLHKRLLRWLRRHGYIEERELEDRSNETPAPTALDGCARIGLAKGTFARLRDGDAEAGADHDGADDERAFEPKRRGRYSVGLEGWDLHAGVRVDADNDVGRERLVRYCSRPSISLERLSLLDDGRVAYRVRHSRLGETHRLMDPLEFMARLAALVPPPRHALVEYFGVLSSHSRLRAEVVPRLAEAEAESLLRHGTTCKHEHRRSADASRPFVRGRPQPGRAAREVGNNPTAGRRSLVTRTSSGRSLLAGQGTGGLCDVSALPDDEAAKPSFRRHQFNVITVQHLDRVLGGALLAQGPRLDWARLLRRTHGFDPLHCPHCGHRLQPIAEITERQTIDRILQAVGYERRTSPRVRGPTRRVGATGVSPCALQPR